MDRPLTCGLTQPKVSPARMIKGDYLFSNLMDITPGEQGHFDVTGRTPANPGRVVVTVARFARSSVVHVETALAAGSPAETSALSARALLAEPSERQKRFRRHRRYALGRSCGSGSPTAWRN